MLPKKPPKKFNKQIPKNYSKKGDKYNIKQLIHEVFVM